MHLAARAIAFSGASILALTSAAHAQTSDDERAGASAAAQGPVEEAPRQDTLEEIIVTAQKRSQNLQSVPLSISAVTADAALDRGITDLTDLANIVPGVSFTRHNASNYIFVRGVGQSQGNNGIEAPVAVYIDGIYLFSPLGAVMSLNDVQQIEVLKGPQGTLFGRNATGGVVQIFTKDPTEELSVDADIGLGSYRTVEGHLYVAGGLGSGFAGSIALYKREQGEAYGRNLFTGNPLYDTDSAAAHAKLVWNSADGNTKLTFNAVADETTSNAGAGGVFPGFTGPDGQTRFISDHVVNLRADPANSAENQIYSGKIEHDFPDFTIVNIAGYHNLRQSVSIVQNSIPGTLRNPATNQIPPALQGAVDSHNQTWTNEFQIQAPAGQDFQWVGGFYLLRDKSISDSTNSRNNVPFQTLNSVIITKSIAAFAQATRSIVPGLRGTVGLRYTKDTISMTGVSTGAIPTPAAGGLPPQFSNSKVTYRLALDYDIADRVLGYVSYNTGFKAGRYNNIAFDNPPLQPETIAAWEAGIKSELFDRRVRLNVAVYSYDYKNLQLRAGTPDLRSISLNAASARGRGVDVDFEVRPVTGLSISAGAAYFDGIYTEFLRAPCSTYNATTSTVGQQFCVLTDQELPRAPKWSGTLTGTYTLETSIGEFRATSTAAYSSSYNFEPDGAIAQPAYTLVTALLGWRSPSDRIGLEFWGTNLTKARYFNSGASSGTYQYFPANPREFGVRLRYRM